eukprot:TRINITY_DN7398_c0_g1_i2.p1 TRINITY_DN7398_c0_g1~~TRINITY_DN7398_c0_g1_i2.p1  ORF type:complete len:333 (-),score=23.62 TRINITY_DN7398_c0_g1_i2:224-1159(-)
MRGDICMLPGHQMMVKYYFCRACHKFLCKFCLLAHNTMHPIVPFHCPELIYPEMMVTETENIKFYLPKQFEYLLSNDPFIFYCFYSPYSLYLYDLKNKLSSWLYYGDEIPIAYSSAARYKSLLIFSGGKHAGIATKWQERYYGTASEAFSIDLKQKPKPNFKVLARMNSERIKHCLEFVNAGIVICTGGHVEQKCLSSCEIYDYSKDKWTIIPSMNRPQSGHSIAVFNNRIVYTFSMAIDRRELNIELIDMHDIEKGWTRFVFKSLYLREVKAIQGSSHGILIFCTYGERRAYNINLIELKSFTTLFTSLE